MKRGPALCEKREERSASYMGTASESLCVQACESRRIMDQSRK